MRIWTVALLLCGVGAASATPQPRASPARPARPARSVPGGAGAGAGDQWRNIIAEYSRGVRSAGGAGSAWSGGSWSPIPIQVPLQGDNSGRSSVSLLVVPVPVPVPAPQASPAQCTQPASQVVTPAPAAPSYRNPASPEYYYGNQPPLQQFPVPAAPPAPPGPPAVPPSSNPSGFVSNNNPPPLQQYPTIFNNELSQSSVDPAPTATLALPAPSAPSGLISRIDARLARNAPTFPPVADSRILVEQFRAQVPDEPWLPPVVIAPVEVVSTDDHTVDELMETDSYRPTTQNHVSGGAAGEEPLERRHVKCKKRRVEGARGNSAELEQEEQAREPPPPPPRFERSLYIEARLTVPRADYTEPYKVWWDAASGASRVYFHGGTTSIYRMVKTGGLVQSAQIRVDRSADTDVRHCIVSGTRRVSLAERALPALPDLRAFSFAGYVVHDTKRAELWRHTLSGHSGELGGVRGEALTFRHELLLTRSADNYTTTPHWYSVRVDSSVLGADADGYVHYFDKVLEQPHNAAMFHLDIADACETLETTNRMESIEPLREFTSLRRLPRYDGDFAQYKQIFGRTYADDVEEAVRKTLLMQTSRFVASGNREGATFALDVNFLADRLVVERRWLLGVEAAPTDDPGLPFPLPPAEVEAQRGRLPRSFDWRQRGAVTPVRFQGANCMSCWAFATVGAVEGALFRETGRLVPLSEQTLVDCAGPYGGHGCYPGTWPSAAYNYIKDKGLPALDEYPYKGKEQQCRADSVPPVTHISGHLNVTADNILALKVAIRRFGPTVVIIDALHTSLIEYKTGFYHDGRCKKNSHNHAVLAVGWTVHRGETFFILKNSWSTAWGEMGYVKMRASTNTCGVLRKPSLPLLQQGDVRRVPGAALAAGPSYT